ncbi:MAG TPA: response regulator [bacterium]|nr:response regulator [bacterium]
MKTILVVDDSKTARLTLKRKLDLLPEVQVEMADSGEAAVELLSHSAPPDLIFMDVLMGNMSGYEAAATILKNPAMADVPIVMCTSKDAQEDRDEAARNGAKGFIIKPISDEALEQVVRELVIDRVHAAPSVTQAAPVTPPAITGAEAAIPQPFVITAELEALVRQAVEQSNLQRAEEAASKVASEMASQVVHAALSEHLLQVEDILEGKISILTSSLAALHSAQDQAQAEYKNALAAMPQAGSTVDEERLAALVTNQLTDFEAQEHSKRAIHELDLQTKLEQSLPSLAEQAAQSAAERLINQAMGSHFAMMDNKLQAITAEMAALKSEPQAARLTETPAPQFDEQAMLAQLEQLLERRMNEVLPELVTSQINAQLSAHVAASEDKLFAIEEELHSAIELVTKTGISQPASAVASSLPAEWMQELLAKQDEMLEQRFNAWSEQMDAHITKSEHAMFDRIDDQMNALSSRAAAAAEGAHPSAVGKPQGESSTTKLALGVAALGVVLALIALFI